MITTIMTLQNEIAKRRSFAIISHPDAGKTTMTEKLLLWGQAIHRAGEVKSLLHFVSILYLSPLIRIADILFL